MLFHVSMISQSEAEKNRRRATGVPSTRANRHVRPRVNLGPRPLGLGIEAQRHALAQFAQAEGFEVSREFIEVETGKGADALDRRPQLKAALAAARKLRCHVAVAKLDRLSRDVHFISGLMAHKVTRCPS
jgi:hypothetical protein